MNKRPVAAVIALSVIAVLVCTSVTAQTYIQPFAVEDGIFLAGEAVEAYYRGLMDVAAVHATASIETLSSCLPDGSEEEKAEMCYFMGWACLVLEDLDAAEEWFKKATEIEFIAPEAYGALLKIADLRMPQTWENKEVAIETRKPLYEAARRVCPYNTSLLFPPMGGLLNPRSESAEVTRQSTGKDPDWIAEVPRIHFACSTGVAESFLDMCMWDEAIRGYQLARYTQLQFERTQRRFELPYEAQTYAAIGDCYLAKRDYYHANLWYRMCLDSHSIKKIAYIDAYLKENPIALSPLIEQSKTIVFTSRYRSADADLPPMNRSWFADPRFGEQDLSQPQEPPRPDANKIERAADEYVRSNLHEEAIRLYGLAEELCGVSLKAKIARTQEKYAELLEQFRETRGEHATLMGRDITYAVVAAAYWDAQEAYLKAKDEESSARMAQKAEQAVALDIKHDG